MKRGTRTRARLLVVSLAVAGVIGAGCASISDDARQTSRRALAAATVPSTTTTTEPEPQCDTSVTLAPLTSLPGPGRMPPGILQDIQRRGYLIAGVDLNTLLLSYEDPRNDAQLQGFEIDLLGQIAKAIFGDDHDRVRYIAVNTLQRLDLVEQGKVDVVADAVTVTCGRMQDVAFSAQYLHAAQRLLVPSSSAAQGITDLKGQRICATKGSTSIKIIKQYGAVPYGVETRIDCLVKLQQHKVAAITSDDTILAGFQAQDPFTRVVGGELAQEPYAVAVNSAAGHAPLVRLVNAVLEQMRGNGEWSALYNKWLDPHLGVPGVQPAATYRG